MAGFELSSNIPKWLFFFFFFPKFPEEIHLPMKWAVIAHRLAILLVREKQKSQLAYEEGKTRE